MDDVSTFRHLQPGGHAGPAGEGGVGGLGSTREATECHNNKDGTVDVSYLPTAPGEYKITAKFADDHIPGSPFTCKITGEGKKRNQISVTGFSSKAGFLSHRSQVQGKWGESLAQLLPSDSLPAPHSSPELDFVSPTHSCTVIPVSFLIFDLDLNFHVFADKAGDRLPLRTVSLQATYILRERTSNVD